MPLVFSPSASLVLGAFVARNGPLDHFVRLRRTAPNPLNYTRARNCLYRAVNRFGKLPQSVIARPECAALGRMMLTDLGRSTCVNSVNVTGFDSVYSGSILLRNSISVKERCQSFSRALDITANPDGSQRNGFMK
jgi:hypothetical protein